MILIDAVYIVSGGGERLLSLLFDRLGHRLSVYFLIDQRLDRDRFGQRATSVSGELGRILYYKQHKRLIQKVFCIGNVPPPATLDNVVILLHQSLYLEYSKNVGYRLKWLYIKWLNRKHYNWVVQRKGMKLMLQGEIDNRINIMPFFEKHSIRADTKREKGTLLFVTSSAPHKNADYVIAEFIASKRNSINKLIVTLDNDYFPESNDSIRFVGSVSNTIDLFSKVEYAIIASDTESLGLTIIEAIDCGCKLIAPNRDYVRDICIPSMYYELTKGGLTSILDNLDSGVLQEPRLKVESKLNELIQLIET